jgi:DNA replication protein DnaC
MSGAASVQLNGRDEDLQVFYTFVDRAATGDGAGSLLMSGDPGVGKTVLLELVVSRAADSGIRVLRTSGAEFEANVSSLKGHELLRPPR